MSDLQNRYALRSNSRVEHKKREVHSQNPEKNINGSKQRKTSSSTATAQVVAALMSKTVNSAATVSSKSFFDDKHSPLSSSSSSSSSKIGDSSGSSHGIKRSKSESDGEPSEVENGRKLIVNYSVDPYDYSHDELIFLSVEIFKYYHLLEIFEFSEAAASNFFYAVKDLYRTNNDFHNFRHAWGVMHMCFQILLHGADQHLDAFDILAVLVAAICHDVGHPGNNNAFELAINSDVSKKYAQPNEICVLEKYHASETQSLLSKKATRKNSNILVTLSEGEKQKFFHQVKFIILGTDMAKHSQLVEEAKELINQIVIEHPPVPTELTFKQDNGATSSSSSVGTDSLSGSVLNSPSSSDISGGGSTKSKSRSKLHDRDMVEKQYHNPKVLLQPEVRLALTRIIVHTADIGAQTQQLRIATKWAERVYNEFRSQAEKERALGIVTSPFIHQLSEDYMIYTSQASFIQDIVTPIWGAVFKLLPNLNFAVDQLESNKKHYHEYGETLKSKGSAGKNDKNHSVEDGDNVPEDDRSNTANIQRENDGTPKKRQKKQK